MNYKGNDMTTTTFETAEIGDRVFSPTFGWGEIECIYDNSEKYPMLVKFYSDPDETRYFTFEGYYYKDTMFQSLFWDEVTIEAPVKPVKLAATKVVNGVEIPDISFKPDSGEHCYIPFPTHSDLYLRIYYCCPGLDEYVIANNLCYPDTEEGKQAAILHAKAMLSIL
jgi:hypothetical protein